MATKAEKRTAFVDKLDKLFAEVSPTDGLILTAGFIAGTKGYTPITAMINTATGLISGSSAGSLYGIDPVLKLEGTWAAGLALGLPGLMGAYLTAWQKPPEQKTKEDKDIIDSLGETIALGCIGMLEGYAITRPGTLAGVGEIVKGVGGIIPG